MESHQGVKLPGDNRPAGLLGRRKASLLEEHVIGNTSLRMELNPRTEGPNRGCVTRDIEGTLPVEVKSLKGVR